MTAVGSDDAAQPIQLERIVVSEANSDPRKRSADSRVKQIAKRFRAKRNVYLTVKNPLTCAQLSVKIHNCAEYVGMTYRGA